MIRWIFGAALVALIVVLQPCAVAGDKPLTNQDVVEMVKAGLDEGTILLSIKQSQAEFSTDPKDLIELKKAGVSQPIIQAMLTHGTPQAPANPAAMPVAGAPGALPPGYAPPQMGPQGITAIDGDKRVALRMTTYAQKQKMKFLSNNQTAILPSPRASIRLTSRTPRFELGLPQNVAPEQMVRLMLASVRGETREFELRVNTFDTWARHVPTVTTGVIKTSLEPSPDSPANAVLTTYVLSPVAPLEPGEYVVVQFDSQVWDFGID